MSLIIRHIESGGYELVQEVIKVWRGPAPGTQGVEPGEIHHVYAGLSAVDEEHPLIFGSGDLYVMAPSGRTVAVYHLDQPGQPSDCAAGR
jgi:hypothetical protein